MADDNSHPSYYSHCFVDEIYYLITKTLQHLYNMQLWSFRKYLRPQLDMFLENNNKLKVDTIRISQHLFIKET